MVSESREKKNINTDEKNKGRLKYTQKKGNAKDGQQKSIVRNQRERETQNVDINKRVDKRLEKVNDCGKTDKKVNTDK